MSNFPRPQYSYAVLDTVQAAAADIAVANQVVSIGDPLKPLLYWPTMRQGKCRLISPVAEVLQATTLTPVAADSSTYQFTIQQYDIANGVNITRTYSYTTPASGGTATTICNNFRTMINGDLILNITASGAATLILTATTGFPIFRVFLQILGGGLTQATGTAGVRAVGTPAALALEGITVTGTSYYRWHTEFDKLNGDTNTKPIRQHNVFDWFIVSDAVDTPDLTARITEIMATFASGGSAVDPEILAVV